MCSLLISAFTLLVKPRQEGSLAGDAKLKTQRFRKQQKDNLDWEASFNTWEQTMGDKMAEAKQSVEVLKRKIAGAFRIGQNQQHTCFPSALGL
jgi:hypothetical protein